MARQEMSISHWALELSRELGNWAYPRVTPLAWGIGASTPLRCVVYTQFAEGTISRSSGKWDPIPHQGL